MRDHGPCPKCGKPAEESYVDPQKGEERSFWFCKACGQGLLYLVRYSPMEYGPISSTQAARHGILLERTYSMRSLEKEDA